MMRLEDPPPYLVVAPYLVDLQAEAGEWVRFEHHTYGDELPRKFAESIRRRLQERNHRILVQTHTLRMDPTQPPDKGRIVGLWACWPVTP